MRVGVDVVGLAGFGISVEDEIDATGFLQTVLATAASQGAEGKMYLGCQCHASRNQSSR